MNCESGLPDSAETAEYSDGSARTPVEGLVEMAQEMRSVEKLRIS